MRRAARPTDFELTRDPDDVPSAETPANSGVSLAFPEGGLEAWTCVLGSFMLMLPSFGFQTAGGLNLCHLIAAILTNHLFLQLDRSRTTSALISFLTIVSAMSVGLLRCFLT